jgi:hypothetical protein
MAAAAVCIHRWYSIVSCNADVSQAWRREKEGHPADWRKAWIALPPSLQQSRGASGVARCMCSDFCDHPDREEIALVHIRLRLSGKREN